MGRTVSSDPNVIALPASPTGFTAGDYVYQTSSGYGSVPAGALSTGMFDVGPLATPYYSSTATTSSEITYIEQQGGSLGSQVAAQLTNGNIVYAYGVGNSATFVGTTTVNFRIEDSSGTVIVAQTSTTMTVAGPYSASVIPLPAGGFCIVTTPASGGSVNLNARFYNADGTAATAVLNAAVTLNMSATSSKLKLQALSDDSVIIGFVSGSDLQIRRVTTAGFDATFGTSGVYTVASIANAATVWDFLVDGSNNIHLIYYASTTSIVMRRLNSSGVQQTTSSVSTLTASNVATAIVLTSDGTIRGIVQDGGGITTITWNGTTAALGTRIVTSAQPPAGGAFAAFAQGASGGYVIFYTDFVNATSATNLYVQAFNSSNVSLAAATRVNNMTAVNYRVQLTPIVVSGNTRVYFGVCPVMTTNFSNTSNGNPLGIAYFAYSNTTFALIGSTTINYDWGSQGPYSLAQYIRGSSTPSSARFTIATTGTYPITSANGATLLQKTLIDGSNTTLRVMLAPLGNGDFVAVWSRTAGSYETFIAKYNVQGVLQGSPVTVSSTGNASSYLAATVAVFANGNILVTYTDATTTILRYRIYTSSLGVVSSDNLDAAFTQAPYVASATFGDGDSIAVLFADTGNTLAVKAVRSNGTNSSRIGGGLTAVSPWAYPQVIGHKANVFTIAAFQNNGTSNLVSGYSVRKTGPTTYVAGSDVSFAATFNSGSNAPFTSFPAPVPGTSAYFLGSSTSNAYRIISINPIAAEANKLSVLNTSGSLAGFTVSGSYGGCIGYTGNGLPVLVINRGSTAFLTLAPISIPGDGVGTIPTTGGAVTTTLATSSSTAFVSAIPHIGDAVLIGYIDSSGRPSFVSINLVPFTVNATLTNGVSISTTPLLLTPESGYSLQGIALSSASTGNIGLVKTRGMAQLNSNYSASTLATSFDFRNPFTSGTYGTVVGRNVFMGN